MPITRLICPNCSTECSAYVFYDELGREHIVVGDGDSIRWLGVMFVRADLWKSHVKKESPLADK
ncbi:hypothetical protein [Candidatus Magnetobacterium casense]|uniref:4Fe-4S Mo/W bis-MGD-type domain-containing protein n=1 Tax=Candidatus Magnetobacterium casense TaxID=1455061 RepID=A0ABS6S2R6_9BACT|nr:hypothetical protein [Candidatus Magnetobacterium casensis]MBV6343140.1 hypothetical protein [Candidatus Magnetobacterium casensis]